VLETHFLWFVIILILKVIGMFSVIGQMIFIYLQLKLELFEILNMMFIVKFKKYIIFKVDDLEFLNSR